MVSLVGASLLVTLIVGSIGGFFIYNEMRNAEIHYNNYVVPSLYIAEVKASYWQLNSITLQLAINDDPQKAWQRFRTVDLIKKKYC